MTHDWPSISSFMHSNTNVVRKNMDVNEHEILPNSILRRKLK